MGFSGSDPVNNVGKAFEMFPIAFALSTADMEATYFLEEIKKNEWLNYINIVFLL
jgi:hypothetical protein